MEAKIDKRLLINFAFNLQKDLLSLLEETGEGFLTASVSTEWEDGDHYLTNFKVLGIPVEDTDFSTCTDSGKVLKGYQALSKDFVVEKTDSLITFGPKKS